MPEEYFGKISLMREEVRAMQRRSSVEVRKWTPEEIQWVRDRLDDGYSVPSVAKAVNRTPTAIGIKMKRLKKTNDDYNEHHRAKKYAMNQRIIDAIKPTTVLDVYGGVESWYRDKIPDVQSNDMDARFADAHDWQSDAFQLLTGLYSEKPSRSWDLIDLDPYGSAFENFDLAIRMADRCLVITFGELGHKRWKRLDFVRSAYGIEDIDDLTTENMIYKVQHMGMLHKKKLVPFEVEEYHNISRVAFRIEPFLQTEQWSVKKVDKFVNTPTLDEWFD